MNVKKVLIISTNICHCPPLGSSEIFLAYIFGNLLNASDLSQKVTWDRISHLTVTAWTHTYEGVSKLRWIAHLILNIWEIFIRIYTNTRDILSRSQSLTLWYHPGSCELIPKNGIYYWKALLMLFLSLGGLMTYAYFMKQKTCVTKNIVFIATFTGIPRLKQHINKYHLYCFQTQGW